MLTLHRLRGLILVCALTGQHGAVAAAVPTALRPNILLIVADDMGYSDLGCYGGDIDTPNLDGLAREGIRFTQFYNAARCTQSRAALLTGLYNHQAGLGETPDYRPRPPEYLRHLGPGTVTMAELLRSVGYRTLMSGKWHLGPDRPHWPVDRGFEQVFALIDCCSNYFGRESYHERPGGPKRRALFVENDRPFVPPEEGFFTTDAFADRAADLLAQHDRDVAPFFLYLAFNAPHWPLHAPPEDIRKYRGRYMEGWDCLRERRFARMRAIGILDPQWKLPARHSQIPAWDRVSPEEQEKWELMMAVYAAMVDRMDQAIGRVLAKLDQIGQRDNTLVLFLSDNGASGEQVNAGKPGEPPGDRSSYFGYGIPWASLSNIPWRLYKTTLHEGGISTPLIARWPDGIRTPGRLHDGIGHVVDVMTTVAELAGARYPGSFAGQPTIPLVGTSLLSALRDEGTQPSRRLYWEHWGNHAVRDGRWKLVRRNPGDWELYDMVADRTETNDLAASDKARVRQMALQFNDWAMHAGVVVPYPFPAKNDAIRRPPY